VPIHGVRARERSAVGGRSTSDKSFRRWEPDQRILFPPSIKDFVPKGHLAHFIRDVVRDDLDLSAIFAHYTERRGQPPYHPALMTSLLLHAYSRGIYSSRRIERACEERVDFMALTGGEKPDHSTICLFRSDHREALSALFVQVLALCRDAGMVTLGHVAFDGTKMKANDFGWIPLKSCPSVVQDASCLPPNAQGSETPHISWHSAWRSAGCRTRALQAGKTVTPTACWSRFPPKLHGPSCR